MENYEFVNRKYKDIARYLYDTELELERFMEKAIEDNGEHEKYMAYYRNAVALHNAVAAALLNLNRERKKA